MTIRKRFWGRSRGRGLSSAWGSFWGAPTSLALLARPILNSVPDYPFEEVFPTLTSVSSFRCSAESPSTGSRHVMRRCVVCPSAGITAGTKGFIVPVLRRDSYFSVRLLFFFPFVDVRNAWGSNRHRPNQGTKKSKRQLRKKKITTSVQLADVPARPRSGNGGSLCLRSGPRSGLWRW